MRTRVLALIAMLLSGCRLFAADVRVAIVADDPTNRIAADTLTAALSSLPGITVLERNEVERVLQEQRLPGTPSIDFVRLGRLLRADGLMLLQSARDQTNSSLGVRLVTVNSGVVLDAAMYPLPLHDPDQWGQLIAARFAPLMQKLDVPRDRAIPISILNLRAALSTPAASENERSLNILLFHRLAQERELFVLERRQMEKLQWERELPGPDDQPFWNGSYLLEGVIDQDGPSPDTITVDARLTPPDGTNIVTIEVAGPRDNLPRVAEALTAKVLTALKRQTTVQSWDRDAEAARFEKEAIWASTWHMWPEAAAAAESAWALGHRTIGNATLRVKALLAQADTKEELVFDPVRNFGWAENAPSPELLPSATAAVEAYLALCNSTDSAVWRTNAAWLDLGLDTLRGSSLVLRHWYHFNARKGVYDEPALPVLPSAVRDLAAVLPAGTRRAKLRESYPGYAPPAVPEDCNSLEMARGVFGPLWQETPRDTISLYQDMLNTGAFDRQLNYLIGHDWTDPSWAAWTPADRESGSRLWQAFVNGIELSTNLSIRADGALLALQSASFDPDMARAIEIFLDATMDKQTDRFAPGVSYTTVDVFDELLKAKCGQKPITRRREQFLAEWKTLRFARRKNYLQTVGEFDQFRGGEDFLRAWFTQAQAAELLPVAEDYARRFPKAEKISQLVQHVRDLTTNAPDPYAEFFDDPDFDAARYEELFLNHNFTPEEAQRVLPGFVDYISHAVHSETRNAMYPERDKLKAIAASTTETPPPAQSPAATPAVFRWDRMFLPETREEDPPRKSPGRYINLYPYEGHIFAAVVIDDTLYRMQTGGNFGPGGDYDLYEIDPVAGSSRELARRLPQSALAASPRIDVTRDMVYWVESPTVIGRVDRVTGKVERYKADLPSEFSFVKAFGNRVFVASADYIAELFPRDGSLKLLASKRRNPPANRLDAAGWRDFPDLHLAADGSLNATMAGQSWSYDDSAGDWRLLPSPTNAVAPMYYVGLNTWDIRRWSEPYRFRDFAFNSSTSISNFDGTNLWVLVANRAADRNLTLFWFDPGWELPREIPIELANPPNGNLPAGSDGRLPTAALMSNGLFIAPAAFGTTGASCFWFIPWDDLKGWARAHNPDSRNLPRREPALVAKYDTNHNGFLDPNELEAMYADSAWKKADAEFQARRLLLYLDTNNDGTLEGAELEGIMRLGLGSSTSRSARANQVLPPARASRGPIGPRQVPLATLAPNVPRLLERFDRNHDQALDVDELTDLFVAISSPPSILTRGSATGPPGRIGFPPGAQPPLNTGPVQFQNPQPGTNSPQPPKP